MASGFWTATPALDRDGSCWWLILFPTNVPSAYIEVPSRTCASGTFTNAQVFLGRLLLKYQLDACASGAWPSAKSKGSRPNRSSVLSAGSPRDLPEGFGFLARWVGYSVRYARFGITSSQSFTDSFVRLAAGFGYDHM